MRTTTILTLFILSVIFLVMATIRPYIDEPENSAFNDDWNGTSLLFNYLANEGYTVKVLFSSVTNLRGMESSVILVIDGKSSNYSLIERKFIREFVENGGKLILADRDNKISSRFSVEFSRGNLVDFEHYHKRQDLPMVPYQILDSSGILIMKFPSAIIGYPSEAKFLSMSSRNSWVDVDGDKIINASSDLKGPFPVAIYAEYGKGSAIFVSDPTILTNDMIPRGDNPKFFINAVGLLSNNKQQIVVLDESHLEGNNTCYTDRALSSIGFLNLRNLSILLLLSIAFFSLYLFLAKKRERKTQKTLTEPNVSEFRHLIDDIRGKFRTRLEPYNWIVIMRYKELRRTLLKQIPPSKRESITDEELISLVHRRKGNFNRDELLHLLKACENIKNGKNVVKTLKETKFLEGKIRMYIEMIK